MSDKLESDVAALRKDVDQLRKNLDDIACMALRFAGSAPDAVWSPKKSADMNTVLAGVYAMDGWPPILRWETSDGVWHLACYPDKKRDWWIGQIYPEAGADGLRYRWAPMTTWCQLDSGGNERKLEATITAVSAKVVEYMRSGEWAKP